MQDFDWPFPDKPAPRRSPKQRDGQETRRAICRVLLPDLLSGKAVSLEYLAEQLGYKGSQSIGTMTGWGTNGQGLRLHRTDDGHHVAAVQENVTAIYRCLGLVECLRLAGYQAPTGGPIAQRDIDGFFARVRELPVMGDTQDADDA